jgi:hypothetical protein
VLVLDTGLGLPSADVVVAPNPWRAGQTLTVIYTPSQGFSAGCTLYDLSGEAVVRGADPGGSGRIGIPSGTVSAAQSLANGVYLLEFRQMKGGSVAERSITKIAVIR